MPIELIVNGNPLRTGVAPQLPLLWLLRDELHLVGTKYGCGAGLCGACTVHLNGSAVRACQIPVAALAGAHITTIEGIGATALGIRLKRAWLDLDVMQCGYCQAGQIMAAAALLRSVPRPTDAQIDAAMVGNLCRCGTYVRIRAAIHAAAQSTDPADA